MLWFIWWKTIETIQKLYNSVIYGGLIIMARKIAISTNKGGVLKTSIAVNLAGIISKEKKRVLIIDTDNQGDVVVSFGKNPDVYEKSVYDVLVDGFDIRKAIVKKVYKNIDILPSNDDMDFFEFDVLTKINQYPEPFHLLKNKIEYIDHLYDYIIIDTPPNLGLVQGNVLTATDEVIIPYQPEIYSMRSLVKILNSIISFREKHNPSLKIAGVVGTLVDMRTTLHTESLQECRKYCYANNVRMLETVIPRTIRYANSVAYERLPATLSMKNKELIKSYIDLWKEIK